MVEKKLSIYNNNNNNNHNSYNLSADCTIKRDFIYMQIHAQAYKK